MTSSLLRMQHSSLQVQDSKPQNLHDVREIFDRGGRFPIKTFTESGPESWNDDGIREQAAKRGHLTHFGYGNAIAIDRDIIKTGSVEKDHVWVASNDEVVGKMHHRVFVTVAFDHVDERIGRINLAACHYPTKGRPGQVNADINERYARKLSEWMREVGKGGALAFANGDFNMLDNVKSQDWAHGGPFTSMADELKAWQNTGHGPIDGFCSYDRDGRVSAERFNVLDDSEMKLFTDHYVCRGVWKIQHRKIA